MHEIELHSLRKGMLNKLIEDYPSKEIHMPVVYWKKAAREVIRLLSALSYFAGFVIVILTAAGLEQDVLTDRQFVVWAVTGICLMIVTAVVSWIADRREDNE